ncbi:MULTISPECIES: GNAT family N-acetyltransferase [Psychroserpens]|uniref:GNAT family N-acetyltransferase n=1 Tax=Psychroserpens luteus TaxID=1434066 RepID=A0ABW5ZXV9_9FLAO|nr:GNAT family N-acetyltransferase [Psychroserpens luteus]
MIRPYKPTDKEQLLKVFNLNVPKFFDKNETNDFLEYLEQKPETYLTIEDNNTIVVGTGYYVNEKDKSGRITWIFFDPNYSGQGLGKQSVDYCLNALSKDKRVEKFIVTTSQLAYKFFEKFGYTINRIEEDYWGEGLDLYEMEMFI